MKVNFNLRVQQVRRRGLARDQGNMLVQCLRVKEVHIKLQMRGGVGVGDLVIVAPVKVVRLPTLATYHQRVLAEIFVHRGGAAFLHNTE